jgi:hypothetical protein
MQSPVLIPLVVIGLSFGCPTWGKAPKTIQNGSCLTIQVSERGLNPIVEKHPSLRHLCNLVFHLYGDKKIAEKELLKKIKAIQRQTSPLGDSNSEEKERKESDLNMLNLQIRENGLDIAENQTALRHYEALFSILERFAVSEAFEEQEFWEAWEEEESRGHDMIEAIRLMRIKLLLYSEEKEEKI